MPTWLIPVILRIAIGHGIGPAILKKNSGEEGRIPRFVLSFFVALIITTTAAAVFGGFTPNTSSLVIVGIGWANGFAAYCLWRAVDISLSKTYLFTWLDDVTTLVLAYFILHEGEFVNAWMASGIALSVAAAVISSWLSYRAKQAEETTAISHRNTFKLYGWIIAYSVIWGVVVFLMRYYALQGVSMNTFLPCWYFGSLLATLALYAIAARSGTKLPPMTRGDRVYAGTLGVLLSSTNALAYWALMLVPLVVMQPIYLISETVFPVLIGLFGFGERKHLREGEEFAFGLGAIGALLVIVGFILG